MNGHSDLAFGSLDKSCIYKVLFKLLYKFILSKLIQSINAIFH